MNDAIAGVIALVGFVQQFKKGLPVCEAIDISTFNYERFSDSINIAAHPFEHFQLMEDDLKMHGKSVIEDIKFAVHAFRGGNYERFGENMG